MAGSYIYESQKLKTLDTQIDLLMAEWNKTRTGLKVAVDHIISMDSDWKGKSADKVKNYMTTFHSTSIQAIDGVLTGLQMVVKNYYSDYINVDCDANCIIDTAELDELIRTVTAISTRIEQIGSKIDSECRAITDECGVHFSGFGEQIAKLSGITQYSKDIQISIDSVEQANTGKVSSIASLCANTYQQINSGFSYNLFDFNVSSYSKANKNQINAFIDSYNNACKTINAIAANQETIVKNLGIVNDQLQREYEERQKIGNRIKFGVAIISTVVMIAAAPVTGGASIVVLGFTTGAISGTVNEITDQWVMYGGANDYNVFTSTDWDEVGNSFLKEGANGAFTSCLTLVPVLNGATSFGGKFAQNYMKGGLTDLFSEAYDAVDVLIFGKQVSQEYINGKVVTTYDRNDHTTKYWVDGHFDQYGRWIEGHVDMGKVYETATNTFVVNAGDSLFSTVIDMGIDEYMNDFHSGSNDLSISDRFKETVGLPLLKTTTEVMGGLVTDTLKVGSSAVFSNYDKLQHGEITKDEYKQLAKKEWDEGLDETFDPQKIAFKFGTKLVKNQYEISAKSNAMDSSNYLAAKKRLESDKIKPNKAYEKSGQKADDKDYTDRVEKANGMKATKVDRSKYKYSVPDDEVYKSVKSVIETFADPDALKNIFDRISAS